VIANILKAPPLPFIPPAQHGKPIVIALMAYAGDAEAGAPAVAPLRGLATPVADLVRPIRYPDLFAGPEPPRPVHGVGANFFADALPAGAAESIIAHLETATATMAAVQLRILGGAVARVPADATAFGYRSARLMVNITALHEHAAERADQRAWASSLTRGLSDGTPTGAYVGFLGDDDEDGFGRAYPPATLERLTRVKRQYDADNLFRLNANVSPAEGGRA
jgi:hypothetical protein